MITIDCPVCGHSFRDYAGENASVREDGRMIDYDRYYCCPECGCHIDIQERKKVNYENIKDMEEGY